MAKPSALIVSLVEPCSLLVTAFREYTAMLIRQGSPKVSAYSAALNYNFVPYMQTLLTEIFEDKGDLGRLPESTKILIRDGLDNRYAEQLANGVFRATLSAITSVLPDITFGPNHGYGFDLIEPMDLWVTLPELAEALDDE